MPSFSYRFPDYSKDHEWMEIITPFNDPRDIAESACERAFPQWLWECANLAPFKVEVRSPDGSIDEFLVDIESVPQFYAYPA